MFKFDKILTVTEIGTDLAVKLSWDRQTGRINLVWFVERKSAKLAKTTFAYCSSS
jgi:hypothetical protein